MMCIMRTTISIDDELLAAARERARSQGQTLGQFIEGSLRRQLAAADQGGARPVVPVYHSGTGPRPGLDLTSNRALLEALDEGLELDARR
jgi:hypothetical protein